MEIENADTVPSVISEEHREAVQAALKEASNSMFRTEAEKDLRKEIAEKMKSEYGVPKNIFNKMAKIQFAGDFAKKVQENEQEMEYMMAIFDPSNALEHKD